MPTAETAHSGVLATPIGPLTITTTESGVARVDFGTVAQCSTETRGTSPEATDILEMAMVQLDEYFHRGRRAFTVPLDRSDRVGFRGAVLGALEGVRFGETVSYGELAVRAGSPRAARAVGTAMATNPIAVIVPCHRVLRSGGATGRYGGGVDAKVWLLEMEREVAAATDPMD